MTEERFDSYDDVLERLHGDARMRNVDLDLLDIQSPATLEKARTFVKNIIAQGLISQRQLCKRTGIKATAVSTFLTDKWVGKQGTLYTTASELCKAVDQFLKEQAAEESDISGFAWTRFAEEVKALVAYTLKRRVMSAFVAPAGTGKSTVLKVLKEDTPGAVLITVRHRRAAVKSFLQLWARSLGLDERGRAEDVQDSIISCLAGSGRLQIIDEAHLLAVSTLHVIREVWDQAKIPIVMAGTPSFHSTLTTRRVGVQTSEIMDQLYSRVTLYRDFTSLENHDTGDPERLFTPEDIRKVFARGNLKLSKDGVDFLCKLANSIGNGGLRRCAQIVQVVVDLYPGQVVSAAELDSVMRFKLGPKEASFRMEQAGILAAVDAAEKVAAVG